MNTSHFLENQIEDWVYDLIHKNRNVEIPHDNLRGLRFLDFAETIEYVWRQVAIPRYGIVDLVVKTNQATYIVEIKRGKVDVNTLIQASRYRTGFIGFLKENSKFSEDVNIILIGADLCTDDWVFIPAPDVQVFTVGYNYDGISFDFQRLSGFRMKDEKFTNHLKTMHEDIVIALDEEE